MCLFTRPSIEILAVVKSTPHYKKDLQYVSLAAERWTYLTCEHALVLETSCDCIYEEAVGQLEELPALYREVDACCVGTTW